jgi:hypothetical protein
MNRVPSGLQQYALDYEDFMGWATSTAECLQNLTKVIKHILLVSHKTPAAGHYIELGAVA